MAFFSPVYDVNDERLSFPLLLLPPFLADDGRMAARLTFAH